MWASICYICIHRWITNFICITYNHTSTHYFFSSSSTNTMDKAAPIIHIQHNDIIIWFICSLNAIYIWYSYMETRYIWIECTLHIHSTHTGTQIETLLSGNVHYLPENEKKKREEKKRASTLMPRGISSNLHACGCTPDWFCVRRTHIYIIRSISSIYK